MQVNTKAIVVHRMRYKDKGLIVKLYTASHGYLSFIIRGSGKKKMAGVYQPLNIIDIQSLVKSNSTLHYIKEVRVSDPLHQLQTDPVKMGIAMFISEVLYKSLEEEEPNEALFHYLMYALHWLDSAKNVVNFPISFLIQLSKYYGFPPHAGYRENRPYFSLRDGEFLSSKPIDHVEYLSPEKSIYLQKFLGTNFDESSAINVGGSIRRDLLSQMIVYFQIHLEKMNNIQSHKILEETFSVY